ncbi:hypothetical protein AgCh_030073 [Apium graveolens]
MVSSQKLRRLQKKIVVIYGDRNLKYGVGHGALISRNGLILTAFHLVDKQPIGSNIHVKCDCGDGTKRMKAQILKVEAGLDLALLKVNGTNCEYARVGPEVRMGQNVEIVVSRDGDSFYYTRGIVAFERRPVSDICCREEINFINENTILVQVHGLHGLPGYSGAPIFDSQCRLIGIYSTGYMRMDMLVHREQFKTFCQPYIKEGEEEVEAEAEEVEKKKKKKKIEEGQEVLEEEVEKKKKKKKIEEGQEVLEEEVEKKKKRKRKKIEEGEDLKKKKKKEEAKTKDMEGEEEKGQKKKKIEEGQEVLEEEVEKKKKKIEEGEELKKKKKKKKEEAKTKDMEGEEEKGQKKKKRKKKKKKKIEEGQEVLEEEVEKKKKIEEGEVLKKKKKKKKEEAKTKDMSRDSPSRKF